MPVKKQDSDIKDIIPPLELGDTDINVFMNFGILVSLIILIIDPLLTWLKIRKKRAADKPKDLRKEAINKLHNLKMNFNSILFPIKFQYFCFVFFFISFRCCINQDAFLPNQLSMLHFSFFLFTLFTKYLNSLSAF